MLVIDIGDKKDQVGQEQDKKGQVEKKGLTVKGGPPGGGLGGIGGRPGGQLIGQEERWEGSVSWNVYKRYFGAAGAFLATLVLTLFAVESAGRVSGDWCVLHLLLSFIFFHLFYFISSFLIYLSFANG